MKKLLAKYSPIVFCIIISSVVQKTNAQTVQIVPNPVNSTNPLDYGQINYYLYSYPIVFNNKLYVNYYYLFSNDRHIAEYDGTTLNVIPNPSSNANNILRSSTIYKNKLYYPLGYPNTQIAQYDGANLTLIPNPANGSINPAAQPVVYNDKLYTFFENKLAAFDGTNLSLNSVINSEQSTFGGLLTMYNNSLTVSDTNSIVSLDGATISRVSTPPGAGNNFVSGELWYYPVINNNKLYVDFLDLDADLTGGHHLAEFDGTKFKVIPNPARLDGGNQGFAFTFNNQVYFQYQSENNNGNYIELAKYDGNATQLIPAPAGGHFEENYYYNFEVTYHNNLYILYENAAGIDQLAKYDGNTVTLISNPDAGSFGHNSSLFVYNDKIYSSYSAPGGVEKLISYDGSNFNLISSANGKKTDFTYPIVYNSKLYFTSYGTLAYFDDGTVVVTNYISAANGNWNDPASWVNGVVPPAGAAVIIRHAIICNVNTSCSSINVEQPNGHLTLLTGFKLTVTK